MKRKANATKDNPAEFAKSRQRALEVSVLRWSRSIYYGPEYEQRTYIPSCGDNFSWKEKSSGITWIGVNGGSTRCAVSLTLPSEMTFVRHPSGRTQLDAGSVVRTAVANMGDDSTAICRQMVQSSKTGPFAVVSVAPGNYQVPQQNNYEVSRAVNFLESKLKNRSAISPKETEQLAVCALWYLLGPEFKSNEIEVYGSGKWSGMVGKMSTSKVEEHLDIINQNAARDLVTSLSSLRVVASELMLVV